MMKRIIFTDLRRGQRKTSYIALMGAVIALILIVAVLAVVLPFGNGTSADKFQVYFTIVTAFIPYLVGIPVYQAVITDDFKSRTMQTAIGRGISRQNLILARLIEMILMLVEAFIVFTIIAGICAAVIGVKAIDITNMTTQMWSSSLLIFSHLSIAMLIVFVTLNTTSGLVFYILFEAGVFSILFTLLDTIPFLKEHNFHVSNYLPSGLNTSFYNYTYGVEESGTAAAVEQNIPKGLMYGVILIIVYCVIPLLLSQIVFRKKELDF